MSEDSEATDFLYPMVDGTEEAGDVDELLADLAASAASKAEVSATLRRDSVVAFDTQLDDAADAMAERFDAGGRLFTCGNGGSATDAEGVAALFSLPPAGTRQLASRSLVADVSILTALANDIGFEAVFSRQLIAHGRGADMVMGFSTSGNSANVIAAFERAAEIGMLGIGFAGYQGGAMAACDALDHCLVVPSDSVHRIQEAQSAAAHELWARITRRLDERPAA
jgi:D-sedoheptulose 7-phosphate isomerase